jgi:hypothetical protein
MVLRQSPCHTDPDTHAAFSRIDGASEPTHLIESFTVRSAQQKLASPATGGGYPQSFVSARQAADRFVGGIARRRRQGAEG